MVAPVNTKLFITRRHGSIVFDRTNLTLLDITDLSDPVAVPYEPEDFFTIYNAIFAVNLTSPEVQMSTSYAFLLTLTGTLRATGDENLGLSAKFGHTQLKEFLAAPMVVYNDAWSRKIVSDPDMGKSLALATASYRVISNALSLISSYSSPR
jgi:hypothetical protein